MSVFSIVRDEPPVPGCTVSSRIMPDVTLFTLAEDTGISAEMYPNPKLYVVLDGKIAIGEHSLCGGEGLSADAGSAIGMDAVTSCHYLEINLRRNEDMNAAIHAGEVFTLADKVPYQEGKIVNMDVAHNDKMKLAVMAFAAGTSLSEHAAPGDALIFALDGEAVIGYEGQDHILHAGENFRFAKGGLHAVRADKPFKMALLLTLD